MKKDYEDKVILNIVWLYFAGMVNKKEMLYSLDLMEHSFKKIKK